MSDVHNRFVALIERLRVEDGGGRGWRTRVASRLGIHGPDLTKIVAGKREVGYEMALRAVERLGLSAAEFFGGESGIIDQMHEKRPGAKSSSLLTERYRQLARELVDEHGGDGSHGAQSAAARALGVSKSYLSKILSGDRRAGVAVAERAATSLGFSMDFFTSSEGGTYRDFGASDTVDQITDRYRRLILGIGQEMGNPRGWQRRVAQRLGVRPADVTNVLNGKRRVGLDLADRAVERLGLPAGFFTAPTSGTVHQAHEPLAGDPEYAAIGACLALTPEQWQRVRAYVDARKSP